MATALPPIGTIATRPVDISGCLASFNESTMPNTIRSAGDDNQNIKTRRRATHPTRIADATMVLKQSQVASFKAWFETACHGGVLPTRFIMPWGTEEVHRFSSEPQYSWGFGPRPGEHVCTVAFKLEQLPQWKGI